MKEVFTKSFWQGVKKIYDEALKGPPPADGAPQALAEGSPSPSPISDTAASPSQGTANGQRLGG
jgi:hypothetical protein